MKKQNVIFSGYMLLSSLCSAQQCFAPVNLYAAGGNSTAVTIGDFNGDGKKDLAAAVFNNYRAAIMLGNGFGGFSAATSFVTGVGDRPYSITTADFNGDGKLDLATGNYDLNDVSVLLGDGLGGFSAATHFPIGGRGYSIVSADFNGDNKMDLATANESGNSISILIGNGLGSFSAATNVSLGQYAYSMTKADFNGDGNMDLATANNSGFASVLLGNGSGGFTPASNYAVGTNSQSITSNDFNGDGNIDLVTANRNSNNVSVLLGNGNGSFSAATNFAVGTDPLSVTSADLNDDGKADLAIVLTSVTSNVVILLGNGLGGFASPANISNGPGISNPNFITSSDITGDGKHDLVACSSSNQAIFINRGFNITFTTTNPTCNYTFPMVYGNGSITASVSGGLSSQSLIWNTTPPQSGYTISSLPDGTYALTVSDNNTCSKTDSVILTGPSPLLVSATHTDVSCFGDTDGTATAIVSGGSSPYSYSWNTSPVQTTITAINLPPASYNVTVTDSAGCQVPFTTVTIGEPTALSSTVSSTTNVKCTGLCNGTATINGSGGTLPYTYLWSPSAGSQTTATATALCAASYSVTLTDAGGCTESQNISVAQEPFPIYPSGNNFTNTKCTGTCNGKAFVSDYGLYGGFTYLWDSVAGNQTTDTVTGLCGGYYYVVVSDTNGCSTTKAIYVETVTISDTNIYLTNLAAVDQINVSPSFSAYYTYNLPATINPHPTNPRNFVDPGKKARFKVECTNQKNNGQSIVSGICKVRSNNPYISITDSSSALNNVGWNDKAWSADEFEIDINPNTPPGTNAYIDFVVQENGLQYATTCIAVPITPLFYSPTTASTVDDDSNPDSQGNDNDICDPLETIEFYPWLDNYSTLNAEYVRGRFENLDNLSYINIWNGVQGINTTVYDAGWWNYSFAQPQTVNSNSFNTTPEYDFVFDYNNTNIINNFKLYMVMAGGFKLFPGNALSLVQWTLPYTFTASGSISTDLNLKSEEPMTIFPNPAKDYIVVEGNFQENMNISLIDGSGRVLYNIAEKETDLKCKIKTEDIASGIYFLRIQNGNQQLTKKVSIVR